MAPSARSRPRLAFVSPFRPVPSGISDYAAELLYELVKHYDVRLFSDQPDVDLPQVLPHLPLAPLADLAANGDKYDRILYQIGNAQIHADTYALMRQHPGVAVLHDFHVPMALDFSGRGTQQEHTYPAAVYYSHGHSGLINLLNRRRPEAIKEFPCNLWVWNHSIRVVLHSDFNRRQYTRWYGRPAPETAAVIPHLRCVPDKVDRVAARQALGIPKEDFLVCSFGILDPVKHCGKLLAAWSRFGLADGPNCHLAFVGAHMGGYSNDPEFLQALVALDEGAHSGMTGYVSPAVYRQYLAAADVAVQLRANGRGETSGAVLDCLSHGKPVIINRNGTLDDYPDDIVLKLEDDFSVEDLTHSLEILRRCPKLRRSLGRKSRDHVRHAHDPEKIGHQFCEIIELAAQEKNRRNKARCLGNPAHTFTRPDQPQFMFDVGEMAGNPQRISGIERVTLNLVRELTLAPPEYYRVEPVHRSGAAYTYGHGFARQYLHGLQTGPSADEPVLREGDVFLGVDLNLVRHPDVFDAWIDKLKAHSVKIFFLLHDLLPITHPDYFPDDFPGTFESWLRKIAASADGVLTVSAHTAAEYEKWRRGSNLIPDHPQNIRTVRLGSDLRYAPTAEGYLNLAFPGDETEPVLLMVGTVESRKGYAQAVEAFDLLWADGVSVNLLVIGTAGRGIDAEMLRARRNHPRLRWIENADDATLCHAYRSSAATLCASFAEGFGLPLVEAAAFNKPIIARDIAVFREVADGHAFFFEGPTAADLAARIRQWLALNDAGNAPVCAGMPRLSWAESAADLRDHIFDSDWLATRS